MIVPLALVLVLVVHIVLARVPYPQQAVLAILYLLWAAGLMVLGRLLRKAFGLPALAVTLAWFLVAGAALTTVIGLLQHYDWRGPLEMLIVAKTLPRVYGNLVQSNQFVAYLALGLASLGYLYLRGRVRLAVLAALATPVLYALLLAGSLSAWVYLGAFVVLAAALYLRHRERPHRDLLLYFVALLAGLLAMQWLVPVGWFEGATPAATAAMRISDVAAATSTGMRLRLWGEAWSYFLQAPLLGLGYGQFAWHHFMQLGTTSGTFVTGLFHHAHNIVMQLLAETGLAGAGAVVVGAALWLWGLRRVDFGAELWWVLALLVVLGLYSMIEFPLWYAYFLGIAAVLMGAADGRERLPVPGRMPSLAVGVTLVAGGLLAAHAIAQYHTLEAMLNPREGDVSQAQAKEQIRHLLAERGGLMDPWIELAVARTLNPDRMLLATKLEFSARVMRFLPTPVIAYQHAVLLALNGEQEEAADIFDRAFIAYPDKLPAFAQGIEGLGAGERDALGPLVDRVRAAMAALSREGLDELGRGRQGVKE